MSRQHPTGSDHPQWRGGRVKMGGYIGVMLPDHPRANNGGYVMEHILVAERALGRHLPALAVVHHVDETKTHNAGRNLVICQDRAYHNLLHRRLRALKACGNADAHRCKYCHRYDNQPDITVEHLRANFFSAYHRRCNNAYVSARQRRLAGAA